MFRTVSEPDVPTLRGSTNVQQTSVELEWELGITRVISSSVVFYTDISSVSFPERATTINQLIGLTPGRTYRFYLEVTSYGKTVRSLNHTVITREFFVSFSIFELMLTHWPLSARVVILLAYATQHSVLSRIILRISYSFYSTLLGLLTLPVC